MSLHNCNCAFVQLLIPRTSWGTSGIMHWHASSPSVQTSQLIAYTFAQGNLHSETLTTWSLAQRGVRFVRSFTLKKDNSGATSRRCWQAKLAEQSRPQGNISQKRQKNLDSNHAECLQKTSEKDVGQQSLEQRHIQPAGSCSR